MAPLDPRCDPCATPPDRTAQPIDNKPGLSQIGYRIGTQSAFLESMTRAIAGEPDLARLTTRDVADPSIALADAWATALDVLTFYQERIANEGYIRTASERRSLLELGAEIGYRLRPATAATTELAFTLETAPGAPESVRLDPGTKVQSLPRQDETPQTFETTEQIVAHQAWNSLLARQTRRQRLGPGGSYEP